MQNGGVSKLEVDCYFFEGPNFAILPVLVRDVFCKDLVHLEELLLGDDRPYLPLLGRAVPPLAANIRYIILYIYHAEAGLVFVGFWVALALLDSHRLLLYACILVGWSALVLVEALAAVERVLRLEFLEFEPLGYRRLLFYVHWKLYICKSCFSIWCHLNIKM